MRFLLIEDDIQLCKALHVHFQKQGYQTDMCHNGGEGLLYALQNPYDMMIIDRMLPEVDGLKNGIQTPIILATAMDSLNDKVSGLDCGADDYITKPFAPEELLARIRALTRRPPKLTSSSVLTCWDLCLDTEKLELSGNGKGISLSKKESGLLEIVM